MEKISIIKSWFSENKKTDKFLARLTEQKGEKTQISKIRNESGDLSTDLIEISKITREYYAQLHANKFV